MKTEGFEPLLAYLPYQGKQYQHPDKAGALREEMLAFKRAGQAARQAFKHLVIAVHAQLPDFTLRSVSGWMNQAQIGRPHFWAYLHPAGVSEQMPGFALRLVADKPALAISAEVSFIERKRDAHTLSYQHAVLEVPVSAGIYYLAYGNGQTQRFAGIESQRQLLKEQVATGAVRKVLVKSEIETVQTQPFEVVVAGLVAALERLMPYYQATAQAAVKHQVTEVL